MLCNKSHLHLELTSVYLYLLENKNKYFPVEYRTSDYCVDITSYPTTKDTIIA